MTFSYVFAFGGLLHFVLMLALVSTRMDRRHPGALVVLCLVSAVWHVVYALDYEPNALPHLASGIVDGVRSAAWLAVFAQLLTALGVDRRFERLLDAFAIFVTLLLAGLVYFEPVLGEYGDVRSAVGGARLVLAIMALVVAENLFRSAPALGRWSIKYLCLGGLSVLAFESYTSATLLLTGELSPSLVVAGGYVSLLAFALLALGVLRAPSLPGALQLSHSMVFTAATLIAVAAYLLVAAAGTYYVGIYGGTWRQVIQVLVAIVALVALVALFVSDTVRARFRVFVAKHFQRYKYDYRAEWLRFTKKMSEAATDANVMEASIESIAQIAGSPGGAMWVAETDGDAYRLTAKANSQLDFAQDFAGDDPVPSFCRHHGWVIDLNEYKTQPGSHGALELPEELLRSTKAWLVVPLLLGETLVGMVLLDAPRIVPRLNFEDRDLLKTVGRAVAVHVSQYEASRRLSEHQQFGAYHRFSTFLMHDLKNLIAQLSLVVDNAEKHKHNPAFVDDAISTIRLSVERMSRLMRQFSGRSRASAPIRISLKKVLEAAVGRRRLRRPEPTLRFDCADVFIEADFERLCTIFEHLLANAQEATPSDGTIEVSVELENRAVRVEVADTGTGMTAEFVQHKLFRPFESTKGEAGLGIGAYQAREYVRSISGDIAVRSEPGRGSTFTVKLPVSVPKTATRSAEM